MSLPATASEMGDTVCPVGQKADACVVSKSREGPQGCCIQPILPLMEKRVRPTPAYVASLPRLMEWQPSPSFAAKLYAFGLRRVLKSPSYRQRSVVQDPTPTSNRVKCTKIVTVQDPQPTMSPTKIVTVQDPQPTISPLAVTHTQKIDLHTYKSPAVNPAHDSAASNRVKRTKIVSIQDPEPTISQLAVMHSQKIDMHTNKSPAVHPALPLKPSQALFLSLAHLNKKLKQTLSSSLASHLLE